MLWETIIETLKQLNILYCSIPTATESSSGKKMFLKSKQNAWKICVNKFIFSRVAG